VCESIKIITLRHSAIFFGMHTSFYAIRAAISNKK